MTNTNQITICASNTGDISKGKIRVAGRDQGGAYAVAAWFRQQGYQVVRSHTGTTPLNLLAWSSEELVLVLIRRTRRMPPSLHAIADLYREEIRTFRGLPDPKKSHSPYQFWLSVSCHGWRFFEVMKGGIREITRDL